VSLIESLLSRDAGPLVQFIKYGISGGIATTVHIIVFHALAWRLFPALQESDAAVKLFKLHVPEMDDRRRSFNSMIDNGGAFVVSNLVAYLLNIAFVFTPGRHHWTIEVALFYAVSGISIVFGTALMGWLIRRYGMRTTYAFGANLVTALLINYAVRKFFIFNG
jgi:putative flippase GtrA